MIAITIFMFTSTLVHPEPAGGSLTLAFNPPARPVRDASGCYKTRAKWLAAARIGAKPRIFAMIALSAAEFSGRARSILCMF